LDRKDVSFKKRKGRVMVPSTHDICHITVEPLAELVAGLVGAGNKVLVVSKPSLFRMRWLLGSIHDRLRHGISPLELRDCISLRFTITTIHEGTARWWEDGAPSIAEREEALEYFHDQGWDVSVSIEPMLDHRRDVLKLIRRLHPYADPIWVGKMNHPRRRLAAALDSWQVESPSTVDRLRQLRENQSDEEVRALYRDVEASGLDRVRWKDSIRMVVGLPPSEEPEGGQA
jgi:hypothetical protein